MRGALVVAGIAAAAAVAALWWSERDGATATSAEVDAVDAGTPARAVPAPPSRAAPARQAPGRAAEPSPAEAHRRQLGERTGLAAADALVDRLAAEVTLAADVAEALRSVLREEREAASAIMREHPAGTAAREAAFDQLRADTHHQVEALLDRAQLAAYRRLRPR